MRKICLIIVNVRSAHNVGSMFRSAEGFNAEIMLVGITPRPLGNMLDDRLPHIAKKTHDAIAKTALGAESKVPWRYYTNPEEVIMAAKADDYVVIALEQDSNSIALEKTPTHQNIAFVVGPEVTGLDKEWLEKVDAISEIKMFGRKESFNVSVAAGIALYEARRDT